MKQLGAFLDEAEGSRAADEGEGSASRKQLQLDFDRSALTKIDVLEGEGAREASLGGEGVELGK
ncbi:MAG: hypothetical protein RMJ98_22795 [Myxococcales bacterium]|nr:hypothetical protein [Polyangiaceae bacterium]MDW8252134.1 hypothetical protein [Myxococcales bacterium]